jgi:uncharacterized protein
MADASSILRGFAFPFQIDPRTGGVAATEGTDKLAANLERLLLARIGERLMLRDYGGGASALVQENVNDGLIAVARNQIASAILRYETRVLPQDVTVVPWDGGLTVRVTYLQAQSPGVQTTAIQVS